jgi:hypothetical protein
MVNYAYVSSVIVEEPNPGGLTYSFTRPPPENKKPLILLKGF